MDVPPALMNMFINSTDTLRKREISQSIPSEWNESPPLFHVRVPQRRKFWRGPQEEDTTEDEDPNLLKGVSHYSPCCLSGKEQLTMPTNNCVFHWTLDT